MTEPSTAGGARVLIAEDEKHLAVLLEHFLVGRGHHVTVVHDGRAALATLGAGAFDVALLDVQMPGLDGLAVLRGVHELPLPPQVVVMTGNGTVDTALAAMQAGAYDYVAKPYRMAEVDLLVRRAAERRRLEAERVALASAEDASDLLTSYAPMRALLDTLTRAAPTLGALLLCGEPGTGRASLARLAHRVAGGGPFVELDGAATTPVPDAVVATRIAAAHGGTLFVRAVDALPAEAQWLVAGAASAPLGADAPPAMRLIASTARVPNDLALEPALRERLGALAVAVPPLREREGDVALLADAFARRFGAAASPAVSDDAVARLVRHAWPGNVAELRLVIEGAVARAARERVEPRHLALDEPARRSAAPVPATEP